MRSLSRIEALSTLAMFALISLALAIAAPQLTDVLSSMPLPLNLTLFFQSVSFLLLCLLAWIVRMLVQRLRLIDELLHSIRPKNEVFANEHGDLITQLEVSAQHIQRQSAALSANFDVQFAQVHLINYKRERADAILETMPEGVLFLDDQGLAVTCNEKIGLFTGVEVDQIIGRKFSEWPISDAALAAIGDVLAKLRSGLAGQAHFQPDDERRIGVFGRPVFGLRTSERRLGDLLVLRDMTDEWLAHKGRDEFIAHVAHELKSPLGNIMVYGEELRGLVDPANPFAVECTNTVCDEADRMTRLINNLLDISRIESGSMGLDLQRVRLHDLFEDCMENISYSAKAKGLSTVSKIPPDMAPVYMDKSLIRVAISNLLNNAVKYNREGGRIELVAEETAAGVVLAVQDTGIGIPADDIPHLFEKHYRANDDVAVDRGGHGLGLYLVKRIVDLHHGSIEVSSEHGVGSRFQLTLPTSTVLL